MSARVIDPVPAVSLALLVLALIGLSFGLGSAPVLAEWLWS